MKRVINIISLFVLLASCSTDAMAQNKLKVALRYFMFNNKIPYVTVQTKSKLEGKLQAIPGIEMNIYMDEESPANLVGKVTTNASGDGLAVIPKQMKAMWDAAPGHTFIATSAATKEFEESNTEIEITKAKMLIDTVNEDGTRSIQVKILALKGTDWVPAADVEGKAGTRRLGGFLPAGKEQSYTSDSSGTFLAEYKTERLPGDDNGNILLVAKVEDNDQYGNLVVEKSVPWGVKIEKSNDFDHRTLFSTRMKTPFWLLFMAYTVIGIVWGVLVYLIVVVVKVMKIGFRTP